MLTLNYVSINLRILMKTTTTCMYVSVGEVRIWWEHSN